MPVLDELNRKVTGHAGRTTQASRNRKKGSGSSE